MIASITKGSVCLFVSMLLVSAASAQSGAFKGTYVFTEEGSAGASAPVALLGSITISDAGAVTGIQAVQSNSGVLFQDLQGSFAKDGDTSGTLSLSAVVTDEDGASAAIQQNYRLVIAAGGEAAAVRLNTGYYTVARFVPAAATTATRAKGTFLLADRTVAGRLLARVSTVTFDGAGNASSSEFIKGVPDVAQVSAKGSSTKRTGGFESVTLSSDSTDMNGERQTVTENYLLLQTRGDLRMMRSDNGVYSIVTLVP